MTNKTDWREQYDKFIKRLEYDWGCDIDGDFTYKNKDFIQNLIHQQVTIAVEEERKRILELPVMKMEDLGGHYYEEKIVIEAKNELLQQIKEELEK
jgi:hypothetical protein